MSDKKPNRLRFIIAIVASAIIFGFAGWLLLNRQYAIDQVSVWAYRPPTDIVAIEDRIDFSEKGKFYFYTTHPVVAAGETFNKDCPRQEVGNPILGCYAMGRIYIYDITNAQLDGIEEVTAAHEMLHAIWERMGSSEQRKIGSLLRTEYSKLTDGELKERMDYYARTEPGELENELHSIIGTEVATISPELETYYQQYFTDRSKVLALHSKYDTLFRNLRTQSETLYNELVTLGQSISTRSVQYNSDIAQLSSDINSFNARANSGSFASIAQFNQERAALVTRSNKLEAERTAINNDIATYNVKYKDYQALAAQIELLNDSIDSFDDLQPAPEL